MTRMAIVADLNRCVGCQTCTAACKHANATAPGVQWRKVLDFETGEYPDVHRAFLPVGCMHCEDPPCMDVCPSTATGQRDDGIVTIDYDKCIGCSYCAVACPYQARFKVDTPNEAYGQHLAMDHEVKREQWDRRSVAQKCTLCVGLIDGGKARGLTPGVDAGATPACVTSCIAGALHMGDIDDPDSNVSRLLKENRHFRMHEELGTGPGIFYLYDKDIQAGVNTDPVPMVADPIGLAAVSPKLQTQWDWRAAANFMFGGAGAGLLATAVAVSFYAPADRLSVLLALVLACVGLFSVLLEIGRPWRFMNVLFNSKTSWMTREALAAAPFIAGGALFALLLSPVVGLIAAAGGLTFLYCQAWILLAAKGIPAWRQPAIVPLIVATGLAEGVGLFAFMTAITGPEPAYLQAVIVAAIILVCLRSVFWRRYRSAFLANGAPAASVKALDKSQVNLSLPGQIVILVALAVGLFIPQFAALGGALALLTGWGFKFTLITRASFNQGYAINRVPARGSGESGPGIQPGWVKN